jgi:hypothetical protein
VVKKAVGGISAALFVLRNFKLGGWKATEVEDGLEYVGDVGIVQCCCHSSSSWALKTLIEKSVQHRFDQKLEKLRSDLRTVRMS